MLLLSKLYWLYNICTNDLSKDVKYTWWRLQGGMGPDGAVNNEEEKLLRRSKMNLQVKDFQSNRINFNTVRYKESPVGTQHIDDSYGLHLRQVSR